MRRVRLDLKGRRDRGEQPACREQRGRKARLARLVPPEQRALRVQLAGQARRVQRDRWVRRVRKARRVRKVRQVQRAQLALQDLSARRDSRDPRASQVRRDPRVHRAPLARKARPAYLTGHLGPMLMVLTYPTEHQRFSRRPNPLQ